jgi:MFS superfamily sulfate permease-like transporter
MKTNKKSLAEGDDNMISTVVYFFKEENLEDLKENFSELLKMFEKVEIDKKSYLILTADFDIASGRDNLEDVIETLFDENKNINLEELARKLRRKSVGEIIL